MEEKLGVEWCRQDCLLCTCAKFMKEWFLVKILYTVTTVFSRGLTVYSGLENIIMIKLGVRGLNICIFVLCPTNLF